MRRTTGLLLVLALLAGCAGQQAAVQPTPAAPTVAPEPTAVPAEPTAAQEAATAAPSEPTAAPVAEPSAPIDLDVARTGIQATLDTYAQAYAEDDIELLRSTVDQGNAPLRRLVETRFQWAQASALGYGAFELRVVEVTPRDLGFVQAHIESDGGSAYDWLFREVDGRWLLSEPTERQLGKRIKFESEHFIFEAYNWSDELNQQLADMMEQARTKVESKLGKAPTEKYTVILRPIFGLTPPSDPGALAWYQAASRPRGDRIQINAPGGYHFGSYDAGQGWEEQLFTILVHEYTHLVHLRSFPEYYGLSDWMSEGLADYVADRSQSGAVSAALAQGKSFPIVDRTNINTPQDLDHLSLLESDVGLAYGFAYSIVAYIVEQHGGLDGFWKLAGTIRKTPGTGEARYDAALREAFGVSYAEFDAGWRAWLEQNY